MIVVSVSVLKFLRNVFVDSVDESNKIFANLERKNNIQEKEKNYFKFNFKKATNVEKFYLLAKTHSPKTPCTSFPV